MIELRQWKKVFENDLENIIHEMRDVLSLPAVIILTGVVGAGKTTFTKAFVGNKDLDVQSPTYSLVQESGKIAYADFYRLKSPSDIVHLELELYLEDKDFFLLEWGKESLTELKKFVGEEFMFYELLFTVNEPSEKNSFTDSRNLTLYRLN
jgi:tRNA threonylcarbamoyladenosine biosynthesis protein TsaE